MSYFTPKKYRWYTIAVRMSAAMTFDRNSKLSIATCGQLNGWCPVPYSFASLVQKVNKPKASVSTQILLLKELKAQTADYPSPLLLNILNYHFKTMHYEISGLLWTRFGLLWSAHYGAWVSLMLDFFVLEIIS